MQTIHYFLTNKGIEQKMNGNEKTEKLEELEKILLEMYRLGVDNNSAEELKWNSRIEIITKGEVKKWKRIRQNAEAVIRR